MPKIFIKKHLGKINNLFFLIGLSFFAFYMVFKSGERGFFAFDQSIVFDGGYRILKGQIPYKDFICPFGPVVFLIQALFFKFFGVTYFSYIFSAALFNVFAAILSVFMFRLLFPGEKFLSYISGLLTAVWFYPPIGTLYTEQTAFFFSLAAVTLILKALSAQNLCLAGNNFVMFASGALALVALLTKQNVGLFILPLYFLLIIAANLPSWKNIFRCNMIFLAGFMVNMALFILWVCIKSDFRVFFRYFIETALQVGINRVFWQRAHVYNVFLSGAGPLPNKIIILAGLFIALAGSVIYFFRFKGARNSLRRYLLAIILCVYFIFSQYLFISSTSNDPENGFVFIGLIFSLSMALLLYKWEGVSVTDSSLKARTPPILRITIRFTVFLLAAWLLISGIAVSLSRKVNNAFWQAEFPRYLDIKGLESLKWGYPTRIHGVDIKERDIKALYEYLKKKDKGFFIFPDFTIFYALLDKPSLQPVLWFHKGLTYSKLYDPDLDKSIVNGLINGRVEVIVLEEVSWFGTNERIDSFPVLKRYIGQNFRKNRGIGIFKIYEKTM